MDVTAKITGIVPVLILTMTLGGAVFLTLNSDGPPVVVRLDTRIGASLIQTHQDREPVWRKKGAQQFPGDVWSQEDDFFLSEQRWARSQWKKYNIPPGNLLLLLDFGLRQRDSVVNVSVARCKPRPAYE